MKAEIAFRKSSLKYTFILKAAINSDMASLLFQAGNTMLGKKKVIQNFSFIAELHNPRTRCNNATQNQGMTRTKN